MLPPHESACGAHVNSTDAAHLSARKIEVGRSRRRRFHRVPPELSPSSTTPVQLVRSLIPGPAPFEDAPAVMSGEASGPRLKRAPT